MANFPPFRNYLSYCLDQLIRQNRLKSPFLDVGCGEGFFSYFLGSKGWNGKALDLSTASIQVAKERLLNISVVDVENKSFEDENGKYNSIFLLDILEHIEDDRRALKKIASLLTPQGYLVLAVPSNPKQWGWDDDFYGHVRRYTLPELEGKLGEVGLKVFAAWDFTYPFFYFLRRLHLKFNPGISTQLQVNVAERTERSGQVPEWQQSFGSKLLTQMTFFWRPLYWVMFTFFKSNVLRGHEMIVLARSSK